MDHIKSRRRLFHLPRLATCHPEACILIAWLLSCNKLSLDPWLAPNSLPSDILLFRLDISFFSLERNEDTTLDISTCLARR
jgi:hypothetical protein